MDEKLEYLWEYCNGLQKALFVMLEVVTDDPSVAERLHSGFENFARIARQQNAHEAEIKVFDGMLAMTRKKLSPRP